MRVEAIVLSLFFTVLIISLAAFSYFGSASGSGYFGYCKERNPYTGDSGGEDSCAKLNKSFDDKYGESAPGEKILRDYSNLALGTGRAVEAGEYKRTKDSQKALRKEYQPKSAPVKSEK